jgi:short-subunit dehydrogenase
MKADAFRDQVVIITGASSGIGQALALQLAGQGAKVVLAARRADRLEQVAMACRQAGGEALVVPTDVTDEAQCKALVEKTIAAFDRLDMLVNNAGLAVVARLEDYPDLSLFQHTMDVNFYGAVYCTYNSPYIASKFAMHGFFDSLRIELMRRGVSVTIVCPYWVVTGFHEAQMDKDGVPRGPRGRGIYSKNMMTAERCAEIMLRAADRRQREVLMGPGRLIAWLKLISPRLLDRMLIAFLKAAVRREQKNASTGIAAPGSASQG